MRAPFKVTEPGTTGTMVGALPGGERRGPTPYQVLKQARAADELVSEVIRKDPVPDGEARIPWPPAGPVNDAKRLPMRIG